MPEVRAGAQAAPGTPARRSSPSILRRAISLAVVLALLAIAAAPLAATAPRTQAAGAAPKAVVIVGPAGGSTSHFLDIGATIAKQAEAAGMDVRRIFHPRATVERVKANIQGAKFVVYLGHGNGWPSPYAPFQERTKNGFGLNTVEGGAATKHTYYGANWIRNNVKLGANAVVLLVGACYSAGNGEPGMAIPSENVARQRVDNFASGFLGAGASAVFAFGWIQRLNYPQQLMTSNKSFDEMFMTRTNGGPSGFVGWKDKYFASQRTPGATNHLDPHSSHGYYRAASGWLNTTANQWRGRDAIEAAPAPGKDTTPPSVPGDFSATAGDGLQVNLSWAASTDDREGTIKYRVLRNGKRIATTTNTSFQDKPPQAGTFSYKVRAVDAAKNRSGFSPELSVSVSAATAASSVNPTVPTGLETQALGQRRVQLSWNQSSSPAGGTMRYRVFRNGKRIATVTTLTFTDRPANPGTYNYKVRALDSAGKKSAFTPVVTGQAVRGRI